MEKIKKIIIIFIGLFIILIIAIVNFLLWNRNQKQVSRVNNVQQNVVSSENLGNTIMKNSIISQNTVTQEPELLEEFEINTQINEKKNIRVNNAIQTYVKYAKENNISALEGVTGKRKNILNLTILQTTTVEIKEMYEVSNVAGSFYYIAIMNSIGEEDYIILNMDYSNHAFSMIESSKEEFNKGQQGEISNKYQSYIKVIKNKYNEIVEK